MWTAGCDDVLSVPWLEMCGCPWVHMYQPWDDKEDSSQNNRRKLTEKTRSRYPVTCQHVTKTDSSTVINQPESWKAATWKNMRSIPSPSIVTKHESTRYQEASSTVFHKPFPSYSHGDVVMLFCSSVTQSERFLQADQLIIRLQVVVVANFIHVDEKRVRERVQVRYSDLVGSDLPHTLIDVRQIAASVKVRELCDELLEASRSSWNNRRLFGCHHVPQDTLSKVPSPRPV